MRVFVATLGLVLLAGLTGRAQECIGPGGPLSSACGSNPQLGRLGGAYGHVGLAAWPRTQGLALSLGLFHQSPVGVEASIYAPLVTAEDVAPTIATTLAARFAIWRTGFDGPWEQRRRPPKWGLVLGARLGGSLLFGLPEPVAGYAGLTAELVVGGWLLVALRPGLSVLKLPPGASARLPFDTYPMVDLSIGSLAADTYEEPRPREPVPVVTPPAPTAPAEAPAPAPTPPAPAPVEPAPVAPAPVPETPPAAPPAP